MSYTYPWAGCMARFKFQADPSLARAFALVLGRAPAGQEPALLAKLLANQRAVYAADAKAADALLAIGESKRDATIPAGEHAALTAACLALYNLDAAVTRD